MLATYLTRVGRFTHDPNSTFWSQTDYTAFINEARGRVAAEGQCVKVLPPGTNGIASITVSAGGAGYVVAPTVVITGPGTGASATAHLTAGAVSSVTMNAAGTKYDNTTTVTFTGGSGAGAMASPVINCLNTVANQEVYTFATANTLAQLTAGVGSILFVETIAVSWGALKPVLDQMDWNSMQAYLRAYPIISGQPAKWAQLGQGELGSVYLQPIPTQALPMEWNCVCTPIDLVDDTTAEALPYPWTDAVAYYAAYLAFMNARRPEEAANAKALYTDVMKLARATAESSFVPSFYNY